MTAKHGYLLAALLVCNAAQAANWGQIGESENSVLYADFSRPPIVSGDIRRAWFRYVYAKHTQLMRGKELAEAVSFDSFNCREETESTGSTTWYFEDGSTETDPTETAWSPVTQAALGGAHGGTGRRLPEIISEVEMSFICDLKP
jgi:hypothetical protein